VKPMNQVAPPSVRVGLLVASILASLLATLVTRPAVAQDLLAALDPNTVAEVRALLEGIDDHPALRASQRVIDATSAELNGLRFPITVGFEASGTQANITGPDTVPDDVLDDARGWDTSTAIQATLRPFLLGDLADAEAQLRISLVQAEQRYRETKANLQAAALQAATGVLVAEHGVRIAEAGLALAEEAARATAIRIERGAGRELDGERAQLEVARARESLRSAIARVELAKGRLADITGSDTQLSSLPDPAGLPSLPVQIVPSPEVLTAELDVALAQLGLGSSQRGLLPTAQAAYVWDLDESSISVSIESRTFQPTVRYETPSTFEGQQDPTGLGLEVHGVLSVGVAFNLGGDDVAAVEAALARLAAAEAGRTNAQRAAELDAADREETRAAARAEADFTERSYQLALREADEARTQKDLGLATELDVLQADLAALQADLARLNARASLLDAILADYRDLAVPLSEVLP